MLDTLVGEVRGNVALAKLNRLAQSAAQVVLVVLIRTDRQMVGVYPAGGGQELPKFCQTLRSTPQGEKRCLTCRSLVAFGACYRGIIDYTCHGGTAIVAAPAVGRNGNTSDRLVVATSAIASGSRARGWRAAVTQLADLNVDVRRLREAFHELPVLTDEKLQVVRELVEVAAAVLGEIEERVRGQEREVLAGRGNGDETSRDDFPGLPVPLALSRDPSLRRAGSLAGSALVDLVTAMVKRDPSMRYSVCNIARAACVTPNHFSTVFRRHTGQTFSDFLSNERIGVARRLLTDPSLSISEAAHRAGFEDPAYFSRRFRQVSGVSPTSWRNQSGAGVSGS